MDPEERTLRFPEDEARIPWLPLLIDFYSIIDAGIDAAVATAIGEGEKSGSPLACKKGCTNCCTALDNIPVYTHELAGVAWYSVEKVTSPLRDALIKNLLGFNPGDPCPFLIGAGCSVYPMRPAACRQFNVFGRPCSEGEDPYYTRKGDVLTPLSDFVDRAFSAILPFYGITDEIDIRDALAGGFIHTQVGVLQTCNWKGLSLKMAAAKERPDSGFFI